MVLPVLPQLFHGRMEWHSPIEHNAERYVPEDPQGVPGGFIRYICGKLRCTHEIAPAAECDAIFQPLDWRRAN